ncbi:Vacuolar amino acid transporter 3 [Fusarium oxysporum f. sp. albedinis]|nr:Vacuolar amino acid transporter 3 [Fusarium oxysporum f. sp. albedinis]
MVQVAYEEIRSLDPWDKRRAQNVNRSSFQASRRRRFFLRIIFLTTFFPVGAATSVFVVATAISCPSCSTAGAASICSAVSAIISNVEDESLKSCCDGNATSLC